MTEVMARRPLIGETPQMVEIRRLISAVARNRSTVLIRGESGTGKELVAREIHTQGDRAAGPFVAVNCGSVSKTLLESELFGHVKGAFTGALYDTLGFFRAADTGTIFLDEVVEVDVELQSKLLRVLQEREVRPVGSSKTYTVDVRVLAATNRNIEEMLKLGRLREDLYYRLNVVSIELPSLRERKADVQRLIEHFTEKYAFEYGVARKKLHPGTAYLFLQYEWPGNVRELENVIERAYALDAGDVILPEHLPGRMIEGDLAAVTMDEESPVPSLAEAERMAVVQALAAASGNKSKAADYLQIHRNRLARMMRRFKL
ncbi:MAG TPA: sigma 54-interacting transcriptional regulator [Planctomycetota bacterium]|nr:sigma 54-interacting transcriptional regulator [Planctomycetota bacterium]